MKKSLFLISIVTLTIISCKSSYTKIGDKNANYIPYYSKAYEADSLYLVGNYQRSYEILDSLFKKYEPANMNNVNEYSTYIACSVMSGNTEKLDEKIKYSLINYGSYLSQHPDLESIYNKIRKESKINDNQIKLYRLKYYNKFNVELRSKIKEICIEDTNVISGKITDPEQINYFKKKHEETIIKLIDKYGFPNEKITGRIKLDDIQNADFLVVFLHQTAEFKLSYLPLLEKSLLNGKLSPFEYGFIVDRILLEKKESRYGIIANIQIDNKKITDSIRKKIGLPEYGYEEWAFYKRFPDLKE